MQQNRVNKKQAIFALLLALALITASIGGLWLYVVQADAETGLQETEVTQLPETSGVSISLVKYGNYPVNVSEVDLETWYQGFGLTNEEKDRLAVRQAAYETGTRPQEKAPSMPAETGLAIVPLNPDDYAGMTEYFFLPGQRLTDEQLLQLIAYGEEKGVPFTADTLSVKNCMRGGAIETNRFRSAGEDARRDILYRRIVEEGLRPQKQSTLEIALPLTTVADIPVNPDVNSGLDVFHFNPIREMTDEEIITELLLGRSVDYYLSPQTGGDLQPVKDVAKARSIIENVFSMPPSAAKDVFQYSIDAETGAKLLQVTFKTPKINGVESSYYLVIELESGQCRTMSSNIMDDSLYYTDGNGNLMYGSKTGGSSQAAVDMEDQRCIQSAKTVVEKLTSMQIAQIKPITKVSIGNTHDTGVYIAVEMTDGTAYIVTVRYADAVVTGIDYQSGGIKKWLEQTGLTDIG